MDMLSYLDGLINTSFVNTGSYPEFISFSLSSVKKLEEKLQALYNPQNDTYTYWKDFKTNGVLDNYKGIPIKLIDENNEVPKM